MFGVEAGWVVQASSPRATRQTVKDLRFMFAPMRGHRGSVNPEQAVYTDEMHSRSASDLESGGACRRFPGVKCVFVGAMLALASTFFASFVDVVHVEGDHTSFLVLAPHPTLGFAHGGGEEGAWRRAHPTGPEPWWLAGHYCVLWEVTDS